MSQIYNNISAEHRAFIGQQHMFFVATAAPTGTVNLSPKGLESLKVLNEKTIVWYNLTGSTNETAAHILQSQRMTLMFCAFEGTPLVYRVYGSATLLRPDTTEFKQYASLFDSQKAIRQIFVLNVEQCASACGMGVPLYEFIHQRDGLIDYFNPKSEEEIKAYQLRKNLSSIDGFPTDIRKS